MLRKLGILVVALLLVATLGDTLVWYWVARHLRSGWESWAATQRTAGWSVEAGTPQIGGWPVAATLIVPDVALHGGESAIPGGVSWGTQRLTLRLGARHPHILAIGTAGAQHLRVSGGPRIAYTAQRLDVAVPLQSGPEIGPLVLQGQGIRVAMPGDSRHPLVIGTLTARFLPQPTAGRGQPAASLTGDATDIALPGDLAWALGRHMGSLHLDAALDGPLPQATTPTAAATAWRDGGGAIAVHRIATQWGPLGLSASGTLRLDAALQPAGRGEAQVTGYGETLEALARHGVMSRSAALAATAMLSLMASAPAQGGPPAVDVPLSLQDRVLSMQQIPLLRVPALDWPPR